MDFKEILMHYSNSLVQSEIAFFCKEKWIGLHCEAINKNEKKKILIRYFKSGKPLQITQPLDVKNLILSFSRLRPRTIYATANVYKQLNKNGALEYSNLKACMPTWDIDNTIERWDATLQTILELISMLESNGVKKSFFIKFSGRGAHIHIHPYAISSELQAKYNPLSLAWSIVEYIREKTAEKIAEIALKFKAESLSVDNEIDIQRLFVAPLSIHREIPKVSVCLNPNKLENFNPFEDANLNRFKHFESWKNYVIGEADELALKAYNYIGGYPYFKTKNKRRKHPPLDKQILKLIQLNSEKQAPLKINKRII
ncbi:hypothetical protein KEJ50_02195 [Candidatus Bathyarchaeota archaeon]|nr:hypothetical protein [Candidatus Bathyarchaeota archaeon]